MGSAERERERERERESTTVAQARTLTLHEVNKMAMHPLRYFEHKKMIFL